MKTKKELNNEAAKLADDDLEQVTGGLNVYSDERTITMCFSFSDNPSEMMMSIKNNIDRQTGCILHPLVSNTLQNLLNEMSNTGKTYLKINYTKRGEMITDISVKILA